jgi:hypothetical protein
MTHIEFYKFLLEDTRFRINSDGSGATYVYILTPDYAYYTSMDATVVPKQVFRDIARYSHMPVITPQYIKVTLNSVIKEIIRPHDLQ